MFPSLNGFKPAHMYCVHVSSMFTHVYRCIAYMYAILVHNACLQCDLSLCLKKLSVLTFFSQSCTRVEQLDQISCFTAQTMCVSAQGWSFWGLERWVRVGSIGGTVGMCPHKPSLNFFAYRYCIHVRNTDMQYMSPVCLHMRTCMRIHVRNICTQYMLQLCLHVRTGIAYMYAIHIRMCKHRISY